MNGTIKFTAGPGQNLDDAAVEAIDLSRKLDSGVSMEFNRIVTEVNPQSKFEDVIRDHQIGERMKTSAARAALRLG